jgi:hypothetical protein
MRFLLLLCFLFLILECKSTEEKDSNLKRVSKDEEPFVFYESLEEVAKPELPKEHILASRYFEVGISPTGRFTFGLRKEEQVFDLLFGHPNEFQIDGIGTSITTIQIDEKYYLFHTLRELKVSEDKLRGEVVFQGKVPEREIEVIQKIQIFDRERDVIHLIYEIKNNESKPIQAGIRVMLDTYAGHNDGVPFVLPGNLHSQKVFFDKEVLFTPSSSSTWENFDTENKGWVYLRNQMIGNQLNPPDRVILANWGKAISSVWDYELDETSLVTGDSAVISYWNPRQIGAGKNYRIATQYSYYEKPELTGLEREPGNRVENQNLNLVAKNSSKLPQTAKFQIIPQNSEILLDEDNLVFEIPIASESTVTKSIPVTLAGLGEVKIDVIEQISGKSRTQVLTQYIPRKESGFAPLNFSSQKPYPVRYISDRGDLDLIAKVNESLSGKEIGITKLKAMQKKDGKFYYSGEVDLQGYEGEISVIFENLQDIPLESVSSQFSSLGKIIEISNNQTQFKLESNKDNWKSGDILFVIKNGKKIGKLLVERSFGKMIEASFVASQKELAVGMDFGKEE